MPGTQMPDEARKQTLGGAYHLKREMCDVMAHAADDTTHFVSRECAKVNMLQNELDTLDIAVKARTLFGKKAYAATYFIFDEREKSGEKRKCNKDEDEIHHDDYRTERRAKRLISTRSPNFCVASSKRLRTVLLSSLMNGCSRSTWSRK